MRKKISIGFLSLAGLLLFAGVISVFELNRMRSRAREVIEQNALTAALAERLLDALQVRNTAVIKMIVSEDASPAGNYWQGVGDFSAALDEAAGLDGEVSVASIRLAEKNYSTVISGYANEELERDMAWFTGTYLNAYYVLDEAIKDYLASPRASISTRTTQLEKNVYKTITPSILTLIVALIIVLIFYFFVDFYYVKPLRKINTGLKRYLLTHVPFDDSFESSDDLTELKESIFELIEQSKR